MNTWVASLGVARFVWTRHRWLFVACVGFYVAMYSASELIAAQQIQPWLGGLYPLMRFAPVLVPLFVFLSARSAFTLDLAGTESCFPAHFFALPLDSRQLVLPFMGGALLVAALLWGAGFAITDGRLLTGPGEVPPQLRAASTGVETVPFLLASGVAWLQVLVWMSFSRRRTRVWSLVAMIVAHFVMLVLTAGHTLSTLTAIATFVVSIGIAGGLATWGVARARRGDPLVGEERPARRPARKRSRAKPLPPFASPLAAQAWFEWQAHGARHRSPFLWLVPIILALTAMLVLISPGTPFPPEPPVLLAKAAGALVFFVAILFLIAVVSGPSAASFRATITFTQNDDFAMPSFFAALPLPTAAFAWVKMKTAARGMAWLIVLVALFVLLFSFVLGRFAVWVAVFDVLRDRYGALDAALRMVLLPGALALFLLASAANVVWIALLGRGWKVMYVALTAVVTAHALFATAAASHPELMRWIGPILRTLLPWLAVVKIGALIWLTHRVAQRRHFSIPRVASIVVIWVVAVLAAWALGMRLAPNADIGLLYGMVVAMPVLGILAAPLAMQSNRAR